MGIRRAKRGVSVGTTFMLSFTVLTLAVGMFIFTRVAGDMKQISFDANLLAEPLAALTRGVVDSGQGAGAPSPTDPASVSGQVAAAGPTDAPAQPTQPPAPTTPPSINLTLTAMGQITLGSELRQSGQVQSGVYQYEDAFASVAHVIKGSDFAVATLRAGLAAPGQELETYRAPMELAQALQNSGITAINLGTDHALDYGMDGVATTVDTLSGLGLTPIGAYKTQQDLAGMQIIDMSGVPVGVISYTNAVSSAGRKAVSEPSGAMRMLDTDTVAADVQALRQKGAKIVIALAYWGERADTRPPRATRDAADALANAGADIILGVGPTSVHDMERRTVTDVTGTTREVFIAYSLGNFLIDDTRDTPAITGMILQLSIEWNVQNQRATIRDAWYMPTWIMRYKDAEGINRYRVVPAGSLNRPENMTETIFGNMRKAYTNLTTKLGMNAARPRAE